METDQFIKDLCKTNSPPTRLFAPWIRFSAWMIFSVVCLIFYWIFTFQSMNLTEIITHQNALGWIQIFVLFLLFMISSLSSFLISIPGSHRPFYYWMPIGLLLIWMGSITYQIVNHCDFGNLNEGFYCIRGVLILSLLPGLVLFFQIKRAAPLQKRWNGFLAMLSIASLGLLNQQLMFGCDQSGHLLLFHFIPLLFLAGIGVLIGKFLFRWDEI